MSGRASPAEAGRLKTAAAAAAIGVAVLLIAIKAYAYWLTGSVAMLGSLIDSALDLAASAVNMLAIRHAITPADEEHRFGHGKAESIAGLAQAALIAGSAVFLALEAGTRLLHPVPLSNDVTGLVVMGVAIVLTLGLVLFQRFVIRRTASVAIAADHLHYAGDIAMNLGVLLALGLSAFGVVWADPLIGLCIAGLIGFGAYTILRASFDQLMDREFEDADRAKIRALALGEPEVLGVHDLRTRWSGSNAFIQFHIELDPAMALARAHVISDAVEARVLEAFPGAEVLIHQDPAGAESVSARLRA